MSEHRHVRRLTEAEAIHDSDLGKVTKVSKSNFPILERLSLKRVTLKPGAIREPHWHANAHELTYCAAGELIVTIVDNKDGVSRFELSPGEMFFAQSGSLHCFENIGTGDAEMLVAFSHESPQDFSLHATFGAMTDAVLANTFGIDAKAFAAVPRDTSSPYIVKGTGTKGTGTTTPSASSFADAHKFALEAENPPIDFPYGTARVARSQFWPILKNIAMYAIDIPDNGMREVHWHPETAEMGYVHKGRARMTVLDPDGTTDTYLLESGDVYFIPRAYPHQIEVLGDEIHFLIFFDQPMPGDIGLKLSGSAIPRPVLAATFGIDEATFPELPFTSADPLIVAKRNRTDPIEK